MLSEAANSAIRLAASRLPPGRPLSTAAVFATLPGIDHGAGWERLWLATGEPAGLRLSEEPDPGTAAPAYWEGVPLTGELAAALRLVEELSEAYGMRPAPVGLLAVALVADPGAGAARVLTRPGLAHADLLELVQSEILGGSLEGLETHRPAAATPSIEAPATVPATGPAWARPGRVRTR
ncbi:hypothetical protein, partial [Actinoplanes sp. NPDC051411]|uniref:hypothetical protein n=1 Tax=Actinoplanes sp. NPDC051411 TaxID=3155522 RepID=UPI00344922CB